jgi:hypothetical protein
VVNGEEAVNEFICEEEEEGACGEETERKRREFNAVFESTMLMMAAGGESLLGLCTSIIVDRTLWLKSRRRVRVLRSKL